MRPTDVLPTRQATTASRARWTLVDTQAGPGLPIVLLHSLGLDRGVWLPVAQRLAPLARVVVPDLPGHGADAAEAPLRGIAQAADQIVELLDELGIGRALVGGISMGGAMAQELALRHPGRVAGLALLATMPKGFPAFLDRATAAEEGGMEAVVAPTLQRWFRPEDVAASTSAVLYAQACVRALPVAAWASAWRALAAHHAQDRLGSIACPTLCLAGEVDPSTPPALVQSIAAAIPGATFHVVEGAPHLLTLTHSGEVSAHLEGFARRLAA
jgi:3-oxoadipate enol-lactonase